MNQFFDQTAKALTSMAAVLVVMLATVTGMVLFSHTLFLTVFPQSMSHWEKLLATWFMAIGWEATVLITTVNTKHINRNIPGIMAVCSGFIVLFFIQAFDAQQPLLTLVQRWFVGILAATINFIYADLFYSKWQERKELIEQPMKLIELEATVKQLQSKLHDTEPTLHELAALRTFKQQILNELTCPHCKKQQPSYGTLIAHKGHCTENPKKKI